MVGHYNWRRGFKFIVTMATIGKLEEYNIDNEDIIMSGTLYDRKWSGKRKASSCTTDYYRS